MTTVRTTLAVLALSAAAVFSSSAFAAQTPWQQHHPRRQEINHRLHQQNQRITHEVRQGEMTHARAHQLRANAHSVRTQERLMAKQDGGHITRADQAALNQQLNHNSHAIGK